MELPRRLTTALESLTAAVDRLEAAAETRLQADGVQTQLEGELAVMQDDRMRLAGDLGRSMARAQALLSANSDVSERLERISVTVRRLAAEFRSEAPDGEAPA